MLGVGIDSWRDPIWQLCVTPVQPDPADWGMFHQPFGPYRLFERSLAC